MTEVYWWKWMKLVDTVPLQLLPICFKKCKRYAFSLWKQKLSKILTTYLRSVIGRILMKILFFLCITLYEWDYIRNFRIWNYSDFNAHTHMHYMPRQLQTNCYSPPTTGASYNTINREALTIYKRNLIPQDVHRIPILAFCVEKKKWERVRQKHCMLNSFSLILSFPTYII